MSQTPTPPPTPDTDTGEAGDGSARVPLPPASSTPRHDPYAPLRIPAVRYYLIGWLLMILGSQIQSLAIGVEIYDRTKNPTALGLAGLMLALPVLLFSLPGGALADRFDRRRIVLLAMGASVALSLVLALLSWQAAPVPLLYAVLFLSGTTSSMGLPARSAMLPSMVPKDLMASATTWNASAFQLASITGPVLGGILIGQSFPLAYLCAAGLALAFFLLLYKMEGSFVPPPPPPYSSTTPSATAPVRPSLIGTLLEGLRFVWNTPILLATLLLDLLAVILGGVVYVLPVFTRDILNVSDVHLGFLRAAESIGALAMGLIVAHLPPFRRAGRTLLLAVAGFGACVLCFGLSKNFYLSFGLLVLAGAFDAISVIVRHTLVGLLAPEHMRGRINAVNSVFIGSSNELGGFRAGTMAGMIGPIASVVIGGIGTLVSVVFVAFSFPAIRKLGPLSEPKKP